MKIMVVIPTYNERENIGQLIDQIMRLKYDIHVLVVDDNSPDGTGDEVRQIARRNDRVHLFQRTVKSGLGSAYVAGFKHLLTEYKDIDYIIQMDADLSHQPEYIDKFMEKIGDCDVISGSRYLNGRINVINWPLSRLCLSILANRYVRFITGLRLSDITTGYRCYRRKVLEDINLEYIASRGYSFTVEMLYRAYIKGFRLTEIPIVFTDRNKGRSKMGRRDIMESIFMPWRLRLGVR